MLTADSLSEPSRVGWRAPVLEQDGVLGRRSRHPAEVRQCAVRVVAEQGGEYDWQWAGICGGCSPNRSNPDGGELLGNLPQGSPTSPTWPPRPPS